MTDAGRAQAIEDLYRAYEKLPVLQDVAAGRPAVRGHGPLDAPVMIVGEAPGAEEDRTGRPFTGPAGKLLRRLTEEAGIPWGACYVTNALSWLPRRAAKNPYPFEVQASRDRLAGEISVTGPLVVVAAGATAWACVTRNEQGPFTEARFRWSVLGGRRLLCIPHPSFILRLAKGREDWERRTVESLAQAFAAAE